ncbi:MAG: flagellar biosynthesis protein FlhA [Planctomycetaceae bacterium]|nr:flagellar biosynthesis protein FlhA [Planctomycetaceae bacterium]
MPSAAAIAVRGYWFRYRGLIVPVLMAASILVIVVPLPAALLDLLLTANITISVVILLTTLYVKRPLEFSVFPSLLLGTTLARLVLNVASTRLILTRAGTYGTEAAGGVIQTFGEFVAGGQVAVGLIIFTILVAIQFLVITKGATRISEVAARFALDAMPGKQMAIDADLNAGVIDAAGARLRRAEITAQADFYAAMDGAGKFVRGDAIAGIVITLINIVGGLYMGVVEQQMPIGEALRVFTKLTIGDGLVTQVPAFLIALASGLLVTRTSTDSDLPGDMIGQMFVRPEALGVSAAFLAALSFTGLPRFPLLLLAAGLGVVTLILSRRGKPAANIESPAETNVPAAARAASRPEDKLLVDPLELELGYGLIRLADASQGGDLLDCVNRIRARIAQELGMILPKVRIRDNVSLDQRQYRIRIHDVPVAWGEAFPEALLAVGGGSAGGRLPGIAVIEPASGRPAVWIEAAERERAEKLGYRIASPAAAIATHMTEIVRMHSDELLSREQVHQLLENLRQHSPKVVEELVPQTLKPAQVHQVLCNLLRERVPIRNLETILETLGDYADRTNDLLVLTEFVRHALSRTICQQYRDDHQVLRVVTLAPEVEELIEGALARDDRGLSVKLAPQTVETIARGIARQLEAASAPGRPLVLLTPPQIRAALKQMTAGVLPTLAVLSLNEITRDTQVESLGQVSLEPWTRDSQRSLVGAAA